MAQQSQFRSSCRQRRMIPGGDKNFSLLPTLIPYSFFKLWKIAKLKKKIPSKIARRAQQELRISRKWWEFIANFFNSPFANCRKNSQISLSLFWEIYLLREQAKRYRNIHVIFYIFINWNLPNLWLKGSTRTFTGIAKIARFFFQKIAIFVKICTKVNICQNGGWKGSTGSANFW